MFPTSQIRRSLKGLYHTRSVFLFKQKTFGLQILEFVFSAEWSKQKQIGINLAEMTLPELDQHLRQFYAEARNKDGGNYGRATLLSLKNGIDLNTPPNNRGISLVKDPQFVLSNQMLDAKIKQLKEDGMQNTTHKPAIELEDLEKLKNSEIPAFTYSPLVAFEKRVVSHLIVLVPPWL